MIKVDGILTKLKMPDLDGDGHTGGVEEIQQKIDTTISPIISKTESGEILSELNKDTLDQETRMSSIDFKSNLTGIQIPPMVALDSLVALGFLENDMLMINRSLMRKSVSLDRRGRDDIVSIGGGSVRQHNINQSAMGRLKQFFTGKKKEESQDEQKEH